MTLVLYNSHKQAISIDEAIETVTTATIPITRIELLGNNNSTSIVKEIPNSSPLTFDTAINNLEVEITAANINIPNLRSNERERLAILPIKILKAGYALSKISSEYFILPIIRKTDIINNVAARKRIMFGLPCNEDAISFTSREFPAP